MLRELQVNLYKAANSMFTASEAMSTGMGVEINFTNSTVSLPAAETASNIYFVDKERIPTGLNAAKAQMSDYDVNFTEIASGEYVLLKAPQAGERYAVDNYATTGLTAGDVMSVGTDGKWKKASATSGSEVSSIFCYAGTYTDNGRTLAIIQVLPTAITN